MKKIVLKEFTISFFLSLSLIIISKLPYFNLLGGTIYYILIIYIIYVIAIDIAQFKILLYKLLGLMLSITVMSVIMSFTKETPFFPLYLLNLLLSFFD